MVEPASVTVSVSLTPTTTFIGVLRLHDDMGMGQNSTVQASKFTKYQLNLPKPVHSCLQESDVPWLPDYIATEFCPLCVEYIMTGSFPQAWVNKSISILRPISA